MNELEILAASKLTTATAQKKARAAIATGHHAIDFWLHVFGDMEIGEDYTRNVPQKAKPWELLAVALSHLNGVTVESLTREALNADPDMVAHIKKQAEKSISKIKGTTETICSGPIKASLNAEVAQIPTVMAA